MPSLVLFGQKSCFAGDDLRTISIVTIIFRLLQLSLGISALVLTKNHHGDNLFENLDECDTEGYLIPLANHALDIVIMYSIVAIVLSILSIAISIPMYVVSGKGTPTEPERRKSLPFLCHINLTVLNVLRICGFSLGILAILSITDICHCIEFDLLNLQTPENGKLRHACSQEGAWVGMLIALNSTMGIDVVVATSTFICFAANLVSPSLSVSSPETKWQVMCRCCCAFCSTVTCCVFGGSQAILGDFGDLAVALTNLLNSNNILDVTPSDIIVGLNMVSRIQRAKILETRELLQKAQSDSTNMSATTSSGRKRPMRWKSSTDVVEVSDNQSNHRKQRSILRSRSSPSMSSLNDIENDMAINDRPIKLLSRNNPRELFCIAEAAHFLPYAQSTYTWIMYLLEYPFTGLIRLFFLILKGCPCFVSSGDKIYGDYFWMAHTISLKAISGLRGEDIVYASFKQGIKATPYLIALDHKWKTVVLAIRGTLSLESLLADLMIKSVELKKLGDEIGFDGAGHYCHAGMLACSEWIYRDIKRKGKLDELFEGEYSNYRLRIVGHSLGAACATILSLFFRPQYPNLRCLAFSPPGCVLSKELAEECSKWQTSYILDADIVPRLSIESFEDLRDSILECICRIKVPKFRIGQATYEELHSKAALSEANANILLAPEEIHESKFADQVQEFYRFQAQLKAKQQSTYVRLYPPGEIIQLFRTWNRAVFRRASSSNLSEASNNRQQLSEYTARWIKRSDLEKIILSTHLMFDHNPLEIKSKLRTVASNFGLEEPYTSVFPTNV